MWHWTTRTGQFPEAVAFTRRVTDPEPTVTESALETEETEADEAGSPDRDATSCAVRPIGYDLAG
ncbi:hypothetical protein [Nocardia sp. NBC_00416]|uniref:hypothetical protein n=1 Tax=Nocardia sp. NBC_00416 TaxID=2975991 RepID=UPI002E1E3F68